MSGELRIPRTELASEVEIRHRPSGPPSSAATPTEVASGRIRAYVLSALRSEADTAATTQEGARNTTLNRGAYNVARYLHTAAISADEIVDAFLAAAEHNGELHEQGDAVVRDLLHRAIEAGQQNPRALPSVLMAGFDSQGETSGLSPTTVTVYTEVFEAAQHATLDQVGSVFEALRQLPESATRNTQQDTVLTTLAKTLGVSLTSLRRDFQRSCDAQQPHTPAPTNSARLLELFFDTEPELWHTPQAEPHVTVIHDSHQENLSVHGQGFRRYLRLLWHNNTGGVVSHEAVTEVVALVAAKAEFEGKEHATFVRVAETGNGENTRLYLDLGTDTWEAVEILAGAWHVIPSYAVPVKFLRSGTTLPIPTPESGTLHDIAAAIGVGDLAGEAFQHTVAWLLQALRPHGPHPVAVVSGPQGAGKSTISQNICRLLDPNAVQLRSVPRDERDLFISAQHTWIQAADNVSKLSAPLSDAICRLSTGGGYATRRLFSDSDETVLSAQRPVLLNGIANFVERQDLTDRAISVPLSRPSGEEYKTKSTMVRAFEEHRSRALGALLTVASEGLKGVNKQHLQTLPRMSDFAEWIAACAPALAWDMEIFLHRYDTVRTDLLRETLDAAPVVPFVQALVIEKGGAWSGTPTRLLNVLNAARRQRSDSRPPAGWPANAARLSNQLRRLEQGLREVLEIDVVSSRDKNARYWHLTRLNNHAASPAKKQQ